MKISARTLPILLGGTALAGLVSAPAYAQNNPPATAAAEPESVIIVTGTSIQGAQVDDVLPVTVVGEELIDAIDPASGDELFRAIPQAGAVNFNEQSTTGGVNGARGDIASINLRGLGTGNTLLLINGRRMVLNPGFQTELFVPVVSPDTNTIVPGSVRRVEILRDGASAVYGADAVAGVVNTILRGGRTGGFLQGNFRKSTGIDLHSYSVNAGYGFDFADGRGNLTLNAHYFHENGVSADARDYSRSSDLRPFLVGTDFEGDTQFDNRSINSPWGAFDIQGSGATSSNTTALRDDDFHLQPCSLFGPNGAADSDGRVIDLGNGICADNGGTIDRAIRYDLSGDRQLYSKKDRYNLQALFSYELSDTAEVYFEGSYYRSEFFRQREQNTMLSAVPLGIEATAFWNPLGATLLADGSPNPNRVDNGIGSGVTDAGRALELEDYRFVDFGPRQGFVDKDVYRAVLGLRGDIGNWDYDAGLLYSQANTNDLTRNRVSSSLVQAAINRTDSTAYNPFNGGCFPDEPVTGANNNDCTPNPESVLDTARIDVFRKGETTLALADFEVSNANVFELPGGGVGLAVGVEFRRETFADDRDPRLDGTITFTNAVTNATFGSDVVGSSPSPDTDGNREVYSAFAEALVPVISPDMEIPLINELELQLAGRFEDFSDSSSALVPRAAVAWRPFPKGELLLRGAWSQGFRAPNLIQINDEGTTRSNSVLRAVECVAEIIKGIEDDVPDCGTQGTIDFRSGARTLEPEDTQSINLGAVLTPNALPGMTITADYWRVKQEGIIGIFGNRNAVLLDLALRLQGSFNPNVQREAPDAGQIDLFEGTGINPAGDIIQILNPYRNLDTRTSEGLDFGVFYDFDTDIGEFSLQFNAARLLGFEQEPDATSLQTFGEGAAILATIPELAISDLAALLPGGFGELLEIDGRPKWRLSGSVTYEDGPVRINFFGRYIDTFFDDSAQQNDTAAFFLVDDYMTFNASVSYTVEDGPLEDTRFRVGLNNIFNEEPPIADESFGYYGSIHSARGRQISLDVRKNF